MPKNTNYHEDLISLLSYCIPLYHCTILKPFPGLCIFTVVAINLCKNICNLKVTMEL